jgi:hypothetical protein
VAQTKRKRQTKHRGNAAGIVESRGRTGRKPTTAEKSGQGNDSARKKDRLLDSRDRPPTWRGAFFKALVAAVALVAVSLFLFAKKKPAEAFEIFPVVLAMYVPVSYYSDRWVYRRRQRQKAKQGTAGSSR